jgi:hypothetical protein
MLLSNIVPITRKVFTASRIRKFSIYDLFLEAGDPTFKKNDIIVDAYPFKPSQMYPRGDINFSTIKAIYCNELYAMPSVLLKEKNELIFFSQDYANKLLEFGMCVTDILHIRKELICV